MPDFHSNCFKVLLAGLILILPIGCGGKSFDYHPASEIPKGPGLLSDQEDGLVIYDSKKSKAEKSSREPQKAGDQEAAAKSAPSNVNEDKLRNYQEFQEYQEWKEWKKSNKNSGKFKEFQEWREWKSYQEWKKRNDSLSQ